MSPRVFVYDTGMLIALERQEKPAVILHRLLCEHVHPPVVPLPVLAQAWRPGRWTPLSRHLPECTIFGARETAVAGCGVCSGGHGTADAKRAGALLATATIPAEKRPDAVDALVVVIAARHPQSVIVTSDPRDLLAYRNALPGNTAEEGYIGVLGTPDIPDFLSGKRVLG